MLKFKIVTPERIVIETEVDSVSLPTPMGEITILPHHIPLVSNISAGEVRFRQAGREEFLATSSGFVEVTKNNEVIVLADTAEVGAEIDSTRAEAARLKAVEVMSKSYKDEKIFMDASAELQKHLVRLKVARKHRGQNRSELKNI